MKQMQQIFILLWRAYIIRRRHYIWTSIELLIPSIFSLLIISVIKLSLSHVSLEAFDEPVSPNQPDHLDDSITFRPGYREYLGDKKLYYQFSNDINALNFIDEIKYFANKIDPNLNLNLVPFEEIGSKLSNFQNANDSVALVILDDTSGITNKDGYLKYSITDKSGKLQDTWLTEESDSNGFFPLKFGVVQYLINQAYVSLRYKHFKMTMPDYDFRLIKFKTMPEKSKSSHNALSLNIIPFLIVLMICSYNTIVGRLMVEKKSGVKEMFHMTGLGRITYWFCAFLSNFIFVWITIFLASITIFIIGPMMAPVFRSYRNSDFLCVIFIFTIHSVHLISSGLLVSVIATKPLLGTLFGTVLYVFPFFLTHTESIFCALPNYGLLRIGPMILKAGGLRWSMIWRFNEPFSKDISIGIILAIMVGSLSINFILTWYLDSVWPWQPGIRRPFFFPCTGGIFSRKSIEPFHDLNYPKDSKYFEEETESDAAISIRGLSKSFSKFWSSESILAVNNIDLDIHQGSITCLLGHNGAGKTTTMNMITGMLVPSSGRIKISGYDLFSGPSKARAKMTLCPQDNPLDEKMTLREHLILFSGVKGLSHARIREDVDQLIKLLGLIEHQHKLAKKLSGGMKRKLFIGIALVGGSEIIILDEPTAGLDAETRRNIWNVLKAVRHSRTILMTTHDMEEADALADRIVIMHSGSIVCAGSPMFLKNALDTGYVLKISKDASFNTENVLAVLREYLPYAEVENDLGNEIIFNLRDSSDQKTSLADCIDFLDSNKSDLGIKSYGLSASSIEEVFVKIAEISTASVTNESNERGILRPNVEELVQSDVFRVRLTGCYLLKSQFSALIKKRVLLFKRQLYFPLYNFILLFIIILFSKISISRIDDPPQLDTITISPLIYENVPVFLQMDPVDFNSKFKKTLEEYFSDVKEIDPEQNVEKFLKKHLNSTEAEYFVFGLSGVVNPPKTFEPFGWLNVKAPYSISVLLNLIYQTLANMVGGASEIETTLREVSMRISFTGDEEFEKAILKAVIISGVILSSYLFFMASLVSFPIQERLNKSKLLQIMTGTHPLLYHLANFVFDFIVFIVYSAIVIGSIYYLDSNSINHALGLLITTMILFGISAILFFYVISFIFSSPLQGISYSIVLLIIMNGIMEGAYAIMKEVSANFTSSTIQSVIFWFHLNPFFSIFRAVGKLTQHSSLTSFCRNKTENFCSKHDIYLSTQELVNRHCCPGACVLLGKNKICAAELSPLHFGDNGLMDQWLALMVFALIFGGLLMLIECGYKYFTWISSKGSLPVNVQEEDVKEESELVERLIASSDTGSRALLASNLQKKFGIFFPFYAVRGISFSVEENECFGLLGVNGAGKSTTFGILTGDLVATRGAAYIGNLEVFRDGLKYQTNIGYCPQYNPLIENLTGREMLRLFARLRGVPNDTVNIITDEMIRLANIEKYANKFSGTYSGGNKRKLSLALALIGNPKIVLLDEPTAGVDPVARRFLWSTLRYIRRHFNCSIILTSHSMDECENICSRIAIMIRGEFACLGSAQHLRQKFGRGYTLKAKLGKESANNPELVNSLNRAIWYLVPHAKLIDRHASVVTYRIPREVGSWTELFRLFSTLAYEHGLEDFTLSDTNLEQVFIQFAKSKDGNDDENDLINESSHLIP